MTFVISSRRVLTIDKTLVGNILLYNYSMGRIIGKKTIQIMPNFYPTTKLKERR